MDIALWVVQIFLAFGFAGVGFGHIFRYDSVVANPRTAWAKDVGRSNLRIIGVFEVAGALGVVLPAVTGILPWLTPLAAAGLALIMLLSIVFHVRRGEPFVANVLFLVLALVVTVGRTFIEPF